MGEPREKLKSIHKEMERVRKEVPEIAKAFTAFMGTAAHKKGALAVKDKELILIAMSVYNRCESCIVFHTYNALKAGATRQEVLEAAGVATTFGGGPSFIQVGSTLLNTLDDFEKNLPKLKELREHK